MPAGTACKCDPRRPPPHPPAGTSPLYVYGAVFPEGAPDDTNVVLGTFSTIFWTITSIVAVK